MTRIPSCGHKKITVPTAPISTKEMAYFFTLFLEVNDCYAEMYYKLSQKKEEQIRKLIADTDILPSDSFQKLITIFFQED